MKVLIEKGESMAVKLAIDECRGIGTGNIRAFEYISGYFWEQETGRIYETEECQGQSDSNKTI